ncbi:MAG TPA: aldo/keto reductase [Candidatus Omnitrophica bacterium]|nr:aldo/keto reductase [Candidatus Omnitrophota bacterium]
MFIKKRILGQTGLMLPEMGMGCWAIGGQGYGPVSQEDALATLEAAWNSGVRFFDTADVYGDGVSEKLIAQFLRTQSRDEAVIATKVGWDFYQGGHKKNFAPDYLRFACEQSLKRLETDYIDLYQLHNPSAEEMKSGEIFQTLTKLKEQGKIGHIGVSVHREEEALAALKNSRIESLQLIFNALDQRMAVSVFDAAKAKGVGILAREPLACGLLTGKYSADAVFPKGDHRRRYSAEKMKSDIQKIEKVKAALGEKPLSVAALAFVLAHEAVSCVIPGAKSPEQVKANLKATRERVLAPDEVMAIRKLFSDDPQFREHLLPS